MFEHNIKQFLRLENAERMEKDEHEDLKGDAVGMIEVTEQLERELTDGATREDTVNVMSSSRSEELKVDQVNVVKCGR